MYTIYYILYTVEVTNEFDTKYVPKAYLQAEAKDSVVERMPNKKTTRNTGTFEAFTFAGEQSTILNDYDEEDINFSLTSRVTGATK